LEEQMSLEALVDDAISVGTRLGNLEIVSPLSEGGMSRVWLAAARGPKGESLGLRVVKSLRADLPDPAYFERMLVDEGTLGARVCHPNVARVHGVETHRGTPYVVMEFVRGVSLARIRSRLASRGVVLPWSWAAGLGAAFARGLHAAHVCSDEYGRRLGLVHRDVSPSNLMISVDGRPVVIDFGVAKATAVQPHSVVFKGTPRYAAPEQLRGQPVDARADVYGLGAVLYELVTGQRLFDGWSFVQLAERTEPIERFGSVGPSVPEELTRVIRRCLDPSPARRPKSALLVAHALEHVGDAADHPSPDELGRLVAGVRDEASTAYFRALGFSAAPRLARASRPTPSHVRVADWALLRDGLCDPDGDGQWDRGAHLRDGQSDRTRDGQSDRADH
jgi:serine/threonine protein kinase